MRRLGALARWMRGLSRKDGSLGRDLVYAARNLRRHPGYTSVAVVSLALGIGANTAIFSLIDAFVLRPLSYPEPGRLVLVYEPGLTRGRVTRGAPEVFTGLGAAPLIGRSILPENITPGRDRVAVLSHALWRDRFAGSTSIVGRPVRIDGTDYGVAGVDAVSYAGTAITVLLVAFVASGVPAFRASRVDPIEALRHE